MKNKILIVNPFGIGDVLFSMSLVETLRDSRPSAFIAFLGNERTQDLIRMNPSIDACLVFNRDELRDLWKKNPIGFFKRLGSDLGEIKKRGFDTVVDLSLGREFGFFAALLRIRKRVGFDFKGRGLFLTHKKKINGYEKRHVTQIQADLLPLLGIEGRLKMAVPRLVVSEKAKKEAGDVLKKHGLMENDPLVAAAPGGGRSWGANAIYKQWDPERFAETLNRFNNLRGIKVLLLGDDSEKELLCSVAAKTKPKTLVIMHEGLEKVSAFLLRSTLLLCNDGGLLHLANALGVKTVSIFGPVDEKVYGPLNEWTERRVLTEPVPCRPCYARFHFPPCPHNRRCLEELSVEKVLNSVKEIF